MFPTLATVCNTLATTAARNRCLVNTHLLGQFLVVGAIYLKTAVFKVERGVVVVTSF